MCNVAEHVETAGDEQRLGQIGVAGGGWGSNVRLRVVDALRNIRPREEKYAGGIDVRAATVLNTGARVERQRGLGINRTLQRKLGTPLIAELEGHDARVAAAA